MSSALDVALEDPVRGAFLFVIQVAFVWRARGQLRRDLVLALLPNCVRGAAEGIIVAGVAAEGAWGGHGS